MSKRIWLTVAGVLVLIGCITFWGVMSMLKWDFTKLSTCKYETNEYEISQEYNDICIVASSAKISLAVSDDLNSKVECYEKQKAKHSVRVEDGTLIIEINDTRKWYEYIGLDFDTPSITVNIPKGEYGALSIASNTGDVEIPNDFNFTSIDISQSTGNVTNYASAADFVRIKTSTGDILVEDISANSLELSVTTGKVTASDICCANGVTVRVSTGKSNLTGVTCKAFESTGNTGSIMLNNVVALEKLSVKRSTGSVTLEACDASEVLIKTDTGNVMGTFLSEKVFIPRTNTGKIDVPKSVSGGKCEITTNTGDIRITVLTR